MAYKQKPGRGNNPKTGHGLPSPLKQEIEVTKKYEVGKKKLAENRKTGSIPGGMNVDMATGFATVKPYEKKFVENKATRGASIIGGDNKTISQASSYGEGRQVKALRKQFVSDSTSTMNNRKRNVDIYNATSGGISPDKLSKSQKGTLIELGKAYKAPPTRQIGAAIVKGAKDVGAKVMKGIKALDKQANKGSR